MRTSLAILLLLATGLAGCAGDEAPDGCDPSMMASYHPIVVLETNMGTICAELFAEMVPVTVDNFIDIVESGQYDGTTFHRIMTGFMMQGGKTGTFIPSIRDEFHHALRHDQAGLLSMANAGPNTGADEFFITFGPAPHLDDRHSVFGKVVGGLDVLEWVDAKAASSGGEPRRGVSIRSATILEPAFEIPAGGSVNLWTPQSSHGAARDKTTEFLAVVGNGFPSRQTVRVSAIPGDGVSASVETGFRVFELPAGQRAAVIVEVQNDRDGGTVDVVAEIAGINETLRLTVDTVTTGRAVERGQQVTADYVGMTVDGRVFDTSLAGVASVVADTATRAHAIFVPRTAYAPYAFTPGGGVIEGFTELALDLEEGATGAARIPPEKAYGLSGKGPLVGRTLIFQMHILPDGSSP